MSDLIDRQQAIDAIQKLNIPEDMCVFEIISHIEVEIATLPPVQPNHNAEVSKMVDDLISRQAALNIKFKDGILVQEDGIYVRADKVVEGIKALPTAQPKQCRDCALYADRDEWK